MAKQRWTTKKLIRFSNSFANAFGSGLQLQSQSADDRWTQEKLVEMSQARSRAYHPGL